MYSFSPSPSPAPASPPPNSHLYSPGGANHPNKSGGGGGAGPSNGAGGGGAGVGGGPGVSNAGQSHAAQQQRYSLSSKSQQAPHGHYGQHHFSFGGPPSPAYPNGPHSHHAASLASHSQHHASPHLSNGVPPPGSHQGPPPPPPHHHSTGAGGGGGPGQGQGPGGGGGGGQGGGGNHNSSNSVGSPLPLSNGGPIPPHWATQLALAQTSRATNSPHHHARAAHLAARGQTTNAIPITDPNHHHRPASSSGGAGGGNTLMNRGNGMQHRKDAEEQQQRSGSAASLTRTTLTSTRAGATAADGSTSPSSSAAGTDADGKDKDKERGARTTTTWTTIDMGGMNSKNLSPASFRYDFLTTLYIPHNALAELPPLICKLSNLTLLDASSNKLTSLPAELGLLTHSRELFLFDNHSTNSPPQLGTLYLLETLGVEGNPLPDTLRSLVEKDGTSASISYLRDSCPVPPPPPERAWLTIEPDALPSSADKRPEDSFSLSCYNILCDKYATSQMYGYTPSWALSWEYRKELILQEVLNYGSDIVCSQEVDVEAYESYFLEHLSAQEYDGVHYSKSRARTMSGDEKRAVDGCATFFKSSVFASVEQHSIEFNQIALRRPDFKKTEDMFNRVMTKDNIAVVTLLEHRASGARSIVANAHITWEPQFRDVKLVQVAMSMEELNKISNDFARLPARMNLAEGYDKAPHYSSGAKIPTIICGDFNSEPDSGVYEFLSTGHVEKNHGDFMDHVYGDYAVKGASHGFKLKSAYSHVNELPFTNFTPGFTGTIDYVWYTAPSLGVQGLLGDLDPDYLSTTVGFPNCHFPSDHIPLMSVLKFNN